MSNKKLSKYFVLTPNAYNVLLKSTIKENNLNELDKQMYNILKNEKISSMAEKWLMYSQQLAQLGHNFRRNKNYNNDDNNINNERFIKHDKLKLIPVVTDQSMQTDEIVRPIYVDQGIQATKDELDREDEEYDQLYNKHRTTLNYSENDDSLNETLDNELNAQKPFATPSPSPSHRQSTSMVLPRRSVRIKMREMPKTFDEETSEAAMLFVKNIIKDPVDSNYKTRKSQSPKRKIFIHVPTLSDIHVDLEDVVEIVDSDDDDDDNVELKEKNDKKKSTKRKLKLVKNQTGKGSQLFKWEKY